MTDRAPAHQRGFTLIEAIIAMVITGIVAGIVAVFMALPITGYVDAVRRAEMTDIADLALRRIGFELRRALPNSVRVAAGQLEFVPAQDGGRYRQFGPGNVLDGSATGAVTFDVLGPPVSGATDDYLVVFNTAQPGLDVYAAALDNRRRLTAPAGATVSIAGNGSAFPAFHSPGQRFQIAPKEGPVRYLCSDTVPGPLTRQTNYHAGFSTGSGAQSAILATQVTCVFAYAPANTANGLVTIRLTVSKDGESVTLIHQVHVDNTP